MFTGIVVSGIGVTGIVVTGSIPRLYRDFREQERALHNRNSSDAINTGPARPDRVVHRYIPNR